MATVDEEWFTSLLDGKSMVPSSVHTIDHSSVKVPKARPGKRGHPDGTFITPPLQRKNGAMPAVVASAAPSANHTLGRATVLAVKVPDVPVTQQSTKAAVTATIQTPAADDANECAWAVGAPARSRRERRKVARKNPSPTTNDGYASSEGGPTSVKPSAKLPSKPLATFPTQTASMNLASLRETLEVSDAAADMSALLTEEMNLELAAYTELGAVGGVDLGADAVGAGVVGAGVVHAAGEVARRATLASSPTDFEHAAFEQPAGGTPPVGFEDLTEADLEALPTDASRRKVRHNLTERRRVDRMNQLFNRLAMAIADEKAAPAITLNGVDGVDRALLADGKEVRMDGKEIPKPKWSKADVLEGAINVVNDLRRQLEEERLARSLGVPMTADFPEVHAEDDSYSVPMNAPIL